MLCLLKLSQTIGQTSSDKLIGSIGSIFRLRLLRVSAQHAGLGLDILSFPPPGFFFYFVPGAGTASPACKL